MTIPEYDDPAGDRRGTGSRPRAKPSLAHVRLLHARTRLRHVYANPDATMQADIDALVEQVNASGRSTKPGRPARPISQSPGGDAFLGCESHLYFENRLAGSGPDSTPQ
ncbi:MAG: hypothetical protein GEU80_10245 [Dehalococcoidia bacterium]|nr:hypothetical protein [Dehalococcoidia bacterium]